MRRLPPLNALKCFEAAARHMSFTKAAAELNVTPGAVSQQIKSLEDYVGKPIFVRENRSLRLSVAGEASLPVLRDGLEKLAAAGELLQGGCHTKRLAISVAPSFAAKWLVPRLDAFQVLYPEIDVYIHADMGLVDFALNDVDLAIRYGAGHYADLGVIKLLSEHIVPVCAPGLIVGDPPLKTLSDLAHHTLLHDGSPDNDEKCPNWAMWLRAAGAATLDGASIDGARGPRFNQSSLVIEAAVSGRGVALAKAAIALADLEAARLVVPFDLSLETDFDYYLVYPKANENLPQVNAFIDWVQQQARP